MTRLRSALAVSIAVFLAATGLWEVHAEPPKLILLPVQDRVGKPDLVEVVENTVREALEGRYTLIHPDRVRDLLRAGRIRDAANTSPKQLFNLARELEADRFLSVALLRAADRPVVDVTVAGLGFSAGESKLDWAGFRAASGADFRRTFGRGIIRDLPVLAERVSRQLLDDYLDPDASANQRAYLPNTEIQAFRKQFINTRSMSPLAVLPFDALTTLAPQTAADVAHAAMLGVLHRQGVPLAHPGAIDEILRRRYQMRYGGLDPLSRSTLRTGGGAGWFLAGTVEALEMQGGESPAPRVEVSARVVDVESGQIVWMGGLARDGREQENVFGIDRVQSPGRLLEGILYAFSSDFLRAIEIEGDALE